MQSIGRPAMSLAGQSISVDINDDIDPPEEDTHRKPYPDDEPDTNTADSKNIKTPLPPRLPLL